MRINTGRLYPDPQDDLLYRHARLTTRLGSAEGHQKCLNAYMGEG